MARRDTYCPVEVTLDLIGNKWKILILRELFVGKKRFGELYKAIAGITQKMLTQQLRQMEGDGVINRKLYAEVPPRVLLPMPYMKSKNPFGSITCNKPKR